MLEKSQYLPVIEQFYIVKLQIVWSAMLSLVKMFKGDRRDVNQLK